MGGILCYFNKDWCDTKESSQRSSSRKRSPHLSPRLPSRVSPRISPRAPTSSERYTTQLEHAYSKLGIEIGSPGSSPNTSPIGPNIYHISPKKLPFLNNIHKYLPNIHKGGRITLKHRPNRKSPQRSTRRR